MTQHPPTHRLSVRRPDRQRQVDFARAGALRHGSRVGRQASWGSDVDGHGGAGTSA